MLPEHTGELLPAVMLLLELIATLIILLTEPQPGAVATSVYAPAFTN
jgi:hypothetical protein